MIPPRTMAIVTPTYRPDLERCDLLCRSLDRCAPDVPHFLIVDRRDRPAFAYLASPRRHLLLSEDLIDGAFWRSPGTRGYWISLKTPPVRGWIMQQILKMAAVNAVSEDVLVFCDSDTAFFRPFGLDNLLIDGRVGLLDVGYANEVTDKWVQRASELMGEANLSPDRSYVGNMICWHRDTILSLRHRISETCGRDWKFAVGRSTSFSEYTLYGTYVRDVLGYERTIHEPSDVPLIKPSWDLKLEDSSAIARFFSEFDPRTVGVMIHSKDSIDPKAYAHYLDHAMVR